MRALGVLLAIVALALGVYWWTGVKAPEPGDVSGVAPLAGASAPEPQSKAELETPPAAVSPPATEPHAPTETAEHVPVEIPPVDFEVKYRDWSLERLAGAEVVLGAQIQKTLEGIYAERLKAGLFEEEIKGPGERFTSREFKGPAKTWSEPMDGGRTRYRSIEVPDDEYPQLQAMRKEQSWLTIKLNRLAKAKQG